MRKLWTDINTLMDRAPGACPFFATSARYPEGIPIVARARGDRVEVLDPTHWEVDLRPYTCDFGDDEEDGSCWLYLVLPAAITRRGLNTVFFGDGPCGACVHRLRDMADLLFDDDNWDEFLGKASPALVELTGFLRALVPGTDDCREVARLETHVSDATIRSALAISDQNADLATRRIMDGFEQDGWVCAFDREALRRRVTGLFWQGRASQTRQGSGQGMGGEHVFHPYSWNIFRKAPNQGDGEAHRIPWRKNH